MTMAEIKPAATEYFNSRVPNVQNAHELFADTFDLWATYQSRYDTSNNGYKVIIESYVQKINLEIERYSTVYANEYTRQSTVTATKSGTGKDNGTVTDARQGSTHSTDTGTEVSEVVEQYPAGYVVGTPDAAYIAQRTTTTPEVDEVNTTTTDNNTQTTDKTNEFNENGTTTTEDIDISQRVNDLSITPELVTLIQACVFAFVQQSETKNNRCGGGTWLV